MSQETIGNEIAAAEKALEPRAVAEVICRSLFEQGTIRLPAAMKLIAIGTIGAALMEWKKQLTKEAGGRAADLEKRLADTKNELDNVRLKLAIAQKELGK